MMSASTCARARMRMHGAAACRRQQLQVDEWCDNGAAVGSAIQSDLGGGAACRLLDDGRRTELAAARSCCRRNLSGCGLACVQSRSSIAMMSACRAHGRRQAQAQFKHISIF